MSILRVVENEVEFFTVIETGASGMSHTGLARLVDISQQSISKLLENISTGKTKVKCFKPFCGKDFIQQAKVEINGKIVPISVIPAHLCAVIINYYAYISQHKTAAAEYSAIKFAEMGIESWIQSITGWTATLSAAEMPDEQLEEIAETYIRKILNEGCVAAEINPEAVITILRDSKLTGAGFKLYFYLEMMHIQGLQPEVSQICSDLNISVASFRRWLPEVHEWSRCADWLQLKHREGPEREIQLRLHAELGGTMEAYTPMGPIDLVTKTEVIEIKRISDWKTALGQIFAKAYMFPNKHKRIHLFGESSRQLKKITNHCRDFDVTVTFEKYFAKAGLPAPIG